MISEPEHLFVFLLTILASIMWTARQPALSVLFRYVPPVVWAYAIPMLTTTFGITPASSVVYDRMAAYLLPFALFLLTMSIDFSAILRLGRLALAVMLAATGAIALAFVLSFTIYHPFLPDDAWQSLSVLSGSYIGGSANMLALQQGLGAPDSIMGPVLVVDTVTAYGWLAVVIYLSVYQKQFDTWTGADQSLLEDVEKRARKSATEFRPIDRNDVVFVAAVGLLATVVCRQIGSSLPTIGDPTIISATTWTMLLVVFAGVALSYSRLRQLNAVGSTEIGYAALYLLMTSVGAKADVSGLLDAPLLMLAAATVIVFHLVFLALVCKALKAPMALAAIGSVANIGGAISAPIAAVAYRASLAPVGVLLGIFGYVLGIYVPLLIARVLSSI